MRKISVALYVVVLAAIVAVAFPQASVANPKVDSSGCLECHELGVFGAGDGSIHGTHSNCATCHEGTPGAGNVSSSACLDCHPASAAQLCDLVNFHEDSGSYTPEGPSCIACHSTCGGSTTTTTTPGPSINGNRYEIFLLGPFREGCRTTTVEFRSDNVLILDCMDGFGTYLSLGNIFTALYWTNNYYLGYGMGMLVSGFVQDSYIVAWGLAYFGNIISTVVMTGYIL